MLLDNEDKKSSSDKIIDKVYLIGFLIGLLYGGYLFMSFFSIDDKLSSPYLPKYTSAYLFRLTAIKGFVLLIGLAVAHIAKMFKAIIGLVILLLSLLATQFASWLLFVV